MNDIQLLDHIREPWVWPGGYEKIFITSDGGVLCFSCADENKSIILNSRAYHWNDGWEVVGVDINWESELYCDHCGNKIPSEYGDNEE